MQKLIPHYMVQMVNFITGYFTIRSSAKHPIIVKYIQFQF